MTALDDATKKAITDQLYQQAGLIYAVNDYDAKSRWRNLEAVRTALTKANIPQTGWTIDVIEFARTTLEAKLIELGITPKNTEFVNSLEAGTELTSGPAPTATTPAAPTPEAPPAPTPETPTAT